MWLCCLDARDFNIRWRLRNAARAFRDRPVTLLVRRVVSAQRFEFNGAQLFIALLQLLHTALSCDYWKPHHFSTCDWIWNVLIVFPEEPIFSLACRKPRESRWVSSGNKSTNGRNLRLCHNNTNERLLVSMWNPNRLHLLNSWFISACYSDR